MEHDVWFVLDTRALERNEASAYPPSSGADLSTRECKAWSSRGHHKRELHAHGAITIALAFIGQISHLGTPFFVFSLVLFPSLWFMGLVTFERVIQNTYAVIVYARGINRIRHLYLEYAPQMQPYFILSTHDDSASVVESVGLRASWWQIFVIAPGIIAVIDSVIVGVFVGLLLNGFFALSLLVCTNAGVVTFLVSVVILQRYHWKQFKHTEQIPVLFPGVARQ
jgi:hypothetical protein